MFGKGSLLQLLIYSTGQPETFNMTFRSLRNSPLDLYFLIDFSSSQNIVVGILQTDLPEIGNSKNSRCSFSVVSWLVVSLSSLPLSPPLSPSLFLHPSLHLFFPSLHSPTPFHVWEEGVEARWKRLQLVKQATVFTNPTPPKHQKNG